MIDKLEMTLGMKIRSLRQNTGMTQAVLAEKLGVTDKAVSKWERDASYPDISLFPHLADLLGVTIDDLLQNTIDEENPSRLIQIFEMSHDIRTPLHMILGCASMAELYPDDAVKLRKYLENIRVSGEYLLQTIDRLMQLTGAGDVSDDLSGNIVDVAANYDFSGKNILLAEDMAINREIAYELITSTGADVRFAEDGQICVDMISAAPASTYDLILMDLKMPNLDGIEATKKIRALEDPAKAGIPIIAMTANVYESDRNEAMAAGMNGFVEKPVAIAKLFRTMKDYL